MKSFTCRRDIEAVYFTTEFPPNYSPVIVFPINNSRSPIQWLSGNHFNGGRPNKKEDKNESLS